MKLLVPVAWLWLSKAMLEACGKCESEWYSALGCSQDSVLACGACLNDQYQKSDAPNLTGNNMANVFVTFNQLRILLIDNQMKTVKVHFEVTAWWDDPGIMIDLNRANKVNGAIELAKEQEYRLWHPRANVHQLANADEYDESYLGTSCKLVSANASNMARVKLTAEAKATVYCNFSFSAYPMDQQNCLFKIGTKQQSNINYFLHDHDHSPQNTSIERMAGFLINITFFDGNSAKYHNDTYYLGFEMEMHRAIGPFFFKYYLPCTAIVLVSQISFIIPLTAIPGRIALIVTQFLALVNIFICQMVSTI